MFDKFDKDPAIMNRVPPKGVTYDRPGTS
jgi:hypothetical protein